MDKRLALSLIIVIAFAAAFTLGTQSNPTTHEIYESWKTEHGLSFSAV